MKYVIEGCASTNHGRRINNEDNYYLFGEYKEQVESQEEKISVKTCKNNGLAAVCDGMGGEEAGEEASLVVVKNLSEFEISEVYDKANKQLLHINELVCKKAEELGKKRIGSTFAGIYFDNDRFISGNVGDSRCYLMRNDDLIRLSKDHSEGQAAIDRGIMSEAEAKASPLWNKLTQHLGVGSDEYCIEPYFSKQYEIHADDIFVICSDGLSDMLTDSDIVEILKHDEALDKMSERLITAALERGGKDNITVVLLKAKKSDTKYNPSKIIIAVGVVLIIALSILFAKLYVKDGNIGNTLKVSDYNGGLVSDVDGELESEILK